jgi:nicotinamidase-related amidase
MQDFHPNGHISFASSHPDGPGTFKEHKVPHPVKINEKVQQMMWPDHCIQGTKGAEFHPIIESAIDTKRKEGIPIHIIQKVSLKIVKSKGTRSLTLIHIQTGH